MCLAAHLQSHPAFKAASDLIPNLLTTLLIMNLNWTVHTRHMPTSSQCKCDIKTTCDDVFMNLNWRLGVWSGREYITSRPPVPPIKTQNPSTIIVQVYKACILLYSPLL